MVPSKSRVWPELTRFLMSGAAGISVALAASGAFAQAAGDGPRVIEPEFVGVAGPVRDLTPSADLANVSVPYARPPRLNPLANEPDGGQYGTWNRSPSRDPLIGNESAPEGNTPPLLFSFEGVGNPLGCGGCAPPDTNGAVGPNHYVQMVNATKVAVFDKTGMPLAAPFNLGSLWPPGNCAGNAGDPVVLYDALADRWMLSQFANPTHMCFAVSQTGDPLDAYFLYSFDVGRFPDYFKLGVWPNAYYMSANEGGAVGYSAYAFDRTSMLAGLPATGVKFGGETNLLLPASLDGLTLPPATSSGGYFYTFKSGTFPPHGGGADRIELFTLNPDFANPSMSTFTLAATFPVAPFTYTVCGFFNLDCVKQPGTAARLDVSSEWPMFRFPYRSFDDHEALVGNFTVGGGKGEVGSAIRWFELRNIGGGWTLFQQGTFDPDDGQDRFYGSIAMDALGDIALGYSVSSSQQFPSIRYATRVPSDPLGTLQPEAVVIDGTGAQTGANRWGDYSALTVDPADNCTFWYTNEYYPADAPTTWKTRVGVFMADPSCGGTP